MLLARKTARRLGGSRLSRTPVIRAARPTYRWTLRAIPYREELPILLNARGLLGVAAEVGVAEAEFSDHILSHWAGRRLISIDPWLEMAPDEYVDGCNHPQAVMEESYEVARRRLARFGDRSEIWRLRGDEAAERVPHGSLDFVYIDARHSYEAVREDLTDWFKLVRPGGIISGHDYNDGVFAEGLHGVRSAVDEFFGERGLRVYHTRIDVPFASWIVQVP